MENKEIRELANIERNTRSIEELTDEQLIKLHEMNKNGFLSKFTNKTYFNEFARRGLTW